MDSCRYENVNTRNSKGHVSSIMKQVLACSSVLIQFFASGLCTGTPTVMIPQLQKEGNSTQVIDEELGSWIYSTSGFSVIPWVVALPLITKRYGRKPLQIISAVNSIIIFISLYVSRTPQHILFSEIFQGYIHGCNFTVSRMIIIEYSSSKLRGLFLTMPSAGISWGIWVANVLGTFYPWRSIVLLGLICSIFMFSIIFCPESPYWLASRGRFDECEAAFRWIHGSGAENELRALILEQQDNIGLSNNVGINFKIILQSPEFYKPMVLSIITIFQYLFSGKIFCSLYILDIFKKITSESAAYTAMLVLDAATVISMYIGTYLCKILRRRSLLLTSSFTGVFFLLLISLYLFLVRFSLLEVSDYFLLALLTAHSVSLNVGPMILSLSIYSELISRKYQSLSYIIVALTIAINYAILVKVTPDISASLGLDGSFLLYGIVCGLCTVYLYMYLPETKDKTPLEVAEYFRGKQSIISEALDQ